MDVGEGNVVKELNGDSVECDEACRDTTGELENVSKTKWMM